MDRTIGVNNTLIVRHADKIVALVESSSPSDRGVEPVAFVPLPQRVPFGFHGSWLPD